MTLHHPLFSTKNKQQFELLCNAIIYICDFRLKYTHIMELCSDLDQIKYAFYSETDRIK